MKRKKGLLLFLTVILFLFCFVPSVFSATIDVMIVYDTTAKLWVDREGGGMAIFAEHAVARMNQALVNSSVELTFRLVYVAEVSYTHSNTVDPLLTDLINLRTGTGNLSVVHEWRNTYGADIVAMLVDTEDAYGTVGYSYTLNSYLGQPDYAFSTNAIRSVEISHTLTHEVGHNLGCGHSHYQETNPWDEDYDLIYYSAGWYFTGTNSSDYHTIMAYSYRGENYPYYTEAPLFSTPLLDYQGTLAGRAEDGDNARNIRETMGIVDAYRESITMTLNAPTLYSPADGATGQATNVSVNWTDTNSIPQESSYNIRIKPSGGSYTEYSAVQNATSYATSGLSAGVTYFWSVKAVGNETSTQDSAYPADRSFTVDNLIYVNFAGYGLYKWDGGVWSQINPITPASMTAVGSTLYVDFAAYGLYSWNGTAWTKINDAHPASMTAAGSMLYVDFAAYGLYSWNGTAWTQINTVHPASMIAAGSTLYVDFAAYGLYSWNGTAWTKINTVHPASMTAAGSTLYVDFAAYGLYSWNGTTWTQINAAHATSMTAAGSILYVDFAAYGLYSWNGATWTQINAAHPVGMVASGTDLYANFTGYGLYKWNGSVWSQLNTVVAADMAASP